MRRARKREEEKEKERWGKYRDERPEAERERESTIATKLWACRWGVSELSLQAELCWNAFRAILNFYVLGKGCCSLLTLRSFFFHRTLELFWLSFPYFHPFELFCPFRCFFFLRILCHSRVQLDSVCPILFQIFFYSSIHIYALFDFIYLFVSFILHWHSRWLPLPIMLQDYHVYHRDKIIQKVQTSLENTSGILDWTRLQCWFNRIHSTPLEEFAQVVVVAVWSTRSPPT